MNTKLIVGLVVLFGAQGALAVSPYYVDPANKIVVADGAGQDIYPDVDGNIIVWANYQYVPDTATWTIYARDLSSPGSPAQVLTTTDSTSIPRISGNTVVWYDRALGHMYAYDLSSSGMQPIQLTSQRSYTNMWPSISGSMVVWADSRSDSSGMTSNIWGYDLNDPSSGEHLIVDGGNARLYPCISDNWLVWRAEGAETVMAMDLDNQTAGTVQLDSSSAIGNPHIDGTMVIWNRSTGPNNWDVYGFDLDDMSAGKFPIAVTSNDELAADISGNFALYRVSQFDTIIRGVDLTDIDAGEFTIEAQHMVHASYISLDGNLIVWTENEDLYANTILPEPATLSLLVIGGLVAILRKCK